MKYRLSIFILIWAFTKLHAQELGPVSLLIDPPDFSKLSYSQASDAVNAQEGAVMGSKKDKIGAEYINNLVHQIRSGNLNNEKKVLAVYLLGALHPIDTNSIEALIEISI